MDSATDWQGSVIQMRCCARALVTPSGAQSSQPARSGTSGQTLTIMPGHRAHKLAASTSRQARKYVLLRHSPRGTPRACDSAPMKRPRLIIVRRGDTALFEQLCQRLGDDEGTLIIYDRRLG